MTNPTDKTPSQAREWTVSVPTDRPFISERVEVVEKSAYQAKCDAAVYWQMELNNYREENAMLKAEIERLNKIINDARKCKTCNEVIEKWRGEAFTYKDKIDKIRDDSQSAIKLISHHIMAAGGTNFGSLRSAMDLLKKVGQ